MKKIACSLAALAFVATAFADVLLWQVPTNPATDGGTSIEWDYAMLNYVDSTYTELNYQNSRTIDATATTADAWSGNTQLEDGVVENTKAGSTIASQYTEGKKWYIGLYGGEDGQLIGFSQLMSDTDVQKFRQASQNIASWDGANMIGVGDNAMTFTAVPEPTSGLLLLLGAAVLGLRRRKVA